MSSARTSASRPSVNASRVFATRTTSRAPTTRAAGLSRSQSYAGTPAYHSQVEKDVVAAQRLPIRNETRTQVRAGDYSGFHLNRAEEAAFRGPLPLSQYAINRDPNPQVIKKQSAPLRYGQKVSVRRLQPPTPAPHGDLIVRERQQQIPAGPPVVIRQEGRRAATPPPIVYREEPPRPPTRVPTQVVEVEGKPVPPPARKVIVEKLADAPPKPADILIEKWLPYKPRSRRVVYERSCVPPPPNPRNLVIEWETPCVQVEQVCVDLGVCKADPEAYRREHGCALKQACEIPQLCQGGSCGLQRSATVASASRHSIRLEGDVSVLKRVDLEANGLGEYRRFL